MRRRCDSYTTRRQGFQQTASIYICRFLIRAFSWVVCLIIITTGFLVRVLKLKRTIWVLHFVFCMQIAAQFRYFAFGRCRTSMYYIYNTVVQVGPSVVRA